MPEKNNRYLGRQIAAELLPKNKEGQTLCRFCSKPVLPPRRTMCSAECSHEISIRNNGRYMRNAVYQRDKGICSICGIDTKKNSKTIDK